MKKNSHKGIKKLVSFALALAVAASLLPAAALPAEASEQAAPVETSAAPTEVSGYLDNETPEQIVSLLGLSSTTSIYFGNYGKAYRDQGIFLEYQPKGSVPSVSQVPISMTVSSDEASYYGIACGDTKDEVDRVMKQQGWFVWYSTDRNVSYMKETTDRWYNFEIQLSGGKVTQWYWMNWVQGDFKGDVPFSDVPRGAWFFESVKYVHRNWLMTGLDNSQFGPGQNLARAQFAVILYRMNGEPSVAYTPKFHDVGAGLWYTDAILWASGQGVVTGYSNGNFGPGDYINREQMAVMMYRYAQQKGYNTSTQTDISGYPDAAYVSDFAVEAMRWAVGTGIITGTDNGTRLNPQGNANRAECATIIMRFCERYGIG